MVSALEIHGARHTDTLQPGLSRSHASHLISEQTRWTLSEWHNAAVFREAVRTVINSDDKIASVAADAGYSQAGQFVRQFRAMFGVTPGRMRTLWASIRQTAALSRISSGS
jgi:AraC-like DNA-binding protein